MRCAAKRVSMQEDRVRFDVLVEIFGDLGLETQAPESDTVQLVRSRRRHLAHCQMPGDGSAEAPVPMRFCLVRASQGSFHVVHG
jgi:hypothetical protein